jgi:glycosyltransferase involved in cell wall biosynthesis
VLVPLAERWEKADKREFSRYLCRSLFVLVLGVAIMAAVLVPLGGPLLEFAYGPSIEPFVYLFPYVLVSTGFVALMWFLTDVLTICRRLCELLRANAIAFGVCLASMVPLEQGMGMNGINLTAIIAMAVGAACAGVLLRRAVRSAAAEGADGRAVARPSIVAAARDVSNEADKVLVSIIVPVYNAERYLDRCLSSALAQTYANVEVICVDDGSTDGSPAVLARWTEKEPNRVQVITQENAGVAAARNRGLEAAHGAYVTYLDNDDYLDPDLVEKLLSAAVEEDLDVVCSGYRRPDAMGNVVAEVVPSGEGEWERFMVTAAWSKLFRRSYLVREGISFLDTNIGEDAFFSIPALVLTNRIRALPYCGYNWFCNESSVSNTKQRTSSGLRFERTLDDVLGFLRTRDVQFDECLTHYFVRYIVWFLFYTARGDGAQASQENVRHYEAWLDRQLPSWRDDPLARPLRPQGDMLSSRISTWLFVCHPGLFRLVLAAYRRF